MPTPATTPRLSGYCPATVRLLSLAALELLGLVGPLEDDEFHASVLAPAPFVVLVADGFGLAVATRAQPDRGLVVLDNQPLWSIDVVSQAVGRRSKLGIDATLPLAGRERFRALTVPEGARQRVEAALGSSSR